MQKHLLELVYIPAIRLFQRYKTMNANTVTASNGPTMKYHCTVVLAEKKKQKQRNKETKKTRRCLVTMGQLKTKDPKENNVFFC